MSPRNILEVIEAYNKIDYVDKYWIKYHTEREALMETTRFFKEHTEYTHLILTGDDTVPNYDVVAKLIADFNAHPEIEVISAIIGLDYFTKNNTLSLTIEPVINEEIARTVPSGYYRRLPYVFTSTQGLIRVWYQGFAFTMMARHILELIGLKTWLNNTTEWASDLKFAFDCWKAGIPQYVDLRTFMWHRQRRGESDTEYEILNRGRKGTKKFTKLVLSSASIPKEEPAKILSKEDLEIPMKIYNAQYHLENRKV
jgi:hypothetical protein